MLHFWVTLIFLRCVQTYGQRQPFRDTEQRQEALTYASEAFVFDTNSQIDLSGEPWTSKYGPQNDLGYSGPLTFSHFDYRKCLEDASTPFDIGIVGFPFDTTTSYRPGARFGPYAIRSGSRRQSLGAGRGYTLAWGSSPSDFGSGLLDCGDVPISAYDNAKAIDQMEAAYSTLLSRPVLGGTSEVYKEKTRAFSLDGKEHPRLVTLGGDHTIVLPILRSLHKVYGPVSVIHFDAHLDTWPPRGTTTQEGITHGSFFAVAAGEGLLTNTSIHAGIRCKMLGIEDMEHDDSVGFQVISSEDIDDYGIKKIIEKIRKRIGNKPVYLSLDIDVVGMPSPGTPEVGGWTTREVKRILRGLSGLNFIGADIVEVAPAYDNADITGIAAADIVHDFLSMMLVDGPPEPHGAGPFDETDLLP
ncbi:Arginase/deacetylase [Lentinula raphanica]|nr:Arginase/deacetylase [Lentinula raphanica]